MFTRISPSTEESVQWGQYSNVSIIIFGPFIATTCINVAVVSMSMEVSGFTM